MPSQAVVFSVSPEDFQRVVDVWEASVRATHHFVTEADIQVFKPLVREGLPHVAELACVRDGEGEVIGFIGVTGEQVEMLFVHPAWFYQGIGRRLLTHAVTALGATKVDVNEQNPQAIGFYRRMGFEVIGRSPHDGTGKPYPLLHMQIQGPAAAHSAIMPLEE